MGTHDQRTHGCHHRRGIRHRPGSGTTAFGAQLPRCHRRYRREGPQGDRGLAEWTGSDCGYSTWPTHEAQRDFAGEVRDWAPRPIGAVFNNAGVADGLQRAGRRSRGRSMAVEHQLSRCGQRHPRVPADPRRAERRRDRQHIERLRPGRHAQPKCLLLRQIRCPWLHRFASPGVTGHRRDRDQRSPRRHQHQHRPQRPVAQIPRAAAAARTRWCRNSPPSH